MFMAGAATTVSGPVAEPSHALPSRPMPATATTPGTLAMFATTLSPLAMLPAAATTTTSFDCAYWMADSRSDPVAPCPPSERFATLAP